MTAEERCVLAIKRKFATRPGVGPLHKNANLWYSPSVMVVLSSQFCVLYKIIYAVSSTYQALCYYFSQMLDQNLGAGGQDKESVT